MFGLSKYGIFRIVGRRNYKHDCLYLVLQSGGYQILNYRLMLSLKNRHVHKCGLGNVCNTLGYIELVSLRNDGGSNRVEHHGKNMMKIQFGFG